MFSILIPTFNNLEYLKICIDSLKKNSFIDHQIIVHVNEGTDGTLEYLNNKFIEFTHTKYNAGICKGINIAFKKSKHDLIMYSHDDFYFCPNWDKIILDEIKSINHNRFYLSGSMISPNGYNSVNCGDSFNNFEEKKLLDKYSSLKIHDFQGSTWAPHVIHREYWKMVGGFSEEFFPGSGSDPDLNFKLWIKGIRIFKGLGNSKVYHFGSKTLRKKQNSHGSRGAKLFQFLFLKNII
jgi:glycosyltransferase involved in cell wall biosynthesis